MSKAVLVRYNKAYQPATEDDAEALGKVANGEAIEVTFKRKRNLGHHRKGFKLLQTMFSNQDKYEDFDIFRRVITIEAGWYDQFQRLDGAWCLEAKSLSFASMSQEEFEKVYNSILKVGVESLGMDWLCHTDFA